MNKTGIGICARNGVFSSRVAGILMARENQREAAARVHQNQPPRSPPAKPRYMRLSSRNVLRQGDEYKTPTGEWLPVYGPATGSVHTIGLHPHPGTEYRRPR